MSRSRSMDLERVEDIARDPEAASRRERRHAVHFVIEVLERDEEADELTHIERRRLAAARHKLAVFEGARV